jgi:sigma-B regulation protein RsbU (phosphoserine phosphatase)
MTFVLGGLAAVLLVGYLLWADFNAPLNSRMPVLSPDGKYFAYFNAVEPRQGADSTPYELIVAQPQGRLLARLRIPVGKIYWSNAGHLLVVDESEAQATLIANADERLVVLTRIPLSPASEPRWAPDGTKLAAVRIIRTALQLAIYDIQQPEAFPVPLPADFRLNRPQLLSWSPGSEYLYLLNAEAQESVLQRVGVREGTVQTLVRGIPSASAEPPQASPDSSKIFLPPPQGSVIDAQSGASIWSLPPHADVLWRAWSADSRGLFYFPNPSEILVHDFVSSTDEVLVSGVKPNGFFGRDGKTYFFRSPSSTDSEPASGPAGMSWGWHQADRLGPSPQDLGRVELWPWEQTFEGLILARQDEYTRVRFGLYDPETRTLDPLTFPTDGEDFRSQIKTHRLVLVTGVLYALLAMVVLSRRFGSGAARGFYVLLLLLMVLICGQLIGNREYAGALHFPYRVSLQEMEGLGWSTSSTFPQLLFSRVRLTLAALWALLPLAALHFGMVFPDEFPKLTRRRALKFGLIGLTLLPAAGTVLGRLAGEVPESAMRGLTLVAGAAVLAVWIHTLGASVRHPTDRRQRQRARWLIAAWSLLALGTALILLLRYWESRAAEEALRRLFHTTHTSLFALQAWIIPSAVAYAVRAQKPRSLRTFLRRAMLQVLMGVPATLLFLVVWAATGLVISGSMWASSAAAIFVAVLLTVVAVLPFRGRLRRAIERTFDRPRFELREKLDAFARDLPHTVDREALAKRIEETFARAFGALRSPLFVLNRTTSRLRLQRGKAPPSSEIKTIEFELNEPLCAFLLKTGRPFELGIASDDPGMAPVLENAGARLRKLQGEVVLGLRRGDELLGMMVLGAKANGKLYDADEIEMLKGVAREATAAMENIELFEAAALDREMRHELEAASEIQLKLLPATVPHLTSAQLVGLCSPARSTGGDYYDFLELPGRKVGLALSDVSGKGMPAALRMTTMAGLIRGHAPTAESSAALVEWVNRQLFASSREAKLCSLFYGVYDDASCRLEYVNAGHYPPFLLSSAGVRMLDATGLPLGLFPEIAHETRSLTLEPGAILVLHSKGIVEARNSRGESFGRDRLIGALTAAREGDAERILTRVMAEVRDFEGGVPVEDDQTLVLLKVNPA